MIFKKKENILEEKIDLLIDSLEQSNLRELGFILGNKKQIFWRNTLAGIARGIGIGIRSYINYSCFDICVKTNCIS